MWTVMEARMDVRELAEEEPVARCGKGDARAGHDGSVERDEDAESHGRRNESCSGRAGNYGERSDGGALAGGDLRGRQNVLDGRIGGHEQKADDEQAADEGDGQAALRVADFAGDHGEVVPAIVSPESGDERGHESADAADGVGQSGGEVGKRAGGGSETEAGDDEDENHFERGEDELKLRPPS